MTGDWLGFFLCMRVFSMHHGTKYRLMISGFLRFAFNPGRGYSRFSR